jgi:hypothetical protein
VSFNEALGGHVRSRPNAVNYSFREELNFEAAETQGEGFSHEDGDKYSWLPLSMSRISPQIWWGCAYCGEFIAGSKCEHDFQRDRAMTGSGP